MQELTEEQKSFVRIQVGTWLRVRRETSIPGMPIYAPSEADAHHSCLLWRLLSGKEPLPKAPPRSYSCPDYALGEGEAVTVIDSPFEFPSDDKVSGGKVCINQHSGYKWIDKEKGILQHENGDYFKFTPIGPGNSDERKPVSSISGTIQKVEPPDGHK